jgi:hypothetical protein
MCRCSDLGFLLSVSGGIGSQKGSLRTRSEAWSFTRTRSPTAASPPVIADCAPVTCAVVGSFILGRHYDCVNDTPMRALCGFTGDQRDELPPSQFIELHALALARVTA